MHINRGRESILEGNTLNVQAWVSVVEQSTGSERKGTNQESKLHKEGPWIN